MGNWSQRVKSKLKGAIELGKKKVKIQAQFFSRILRPIDKQKISQYTKEQKYKSIFMKELIRIK